jgi:hypothetical protein
MRDMVHGGLTSVHPGCTHDTMPNRHSPGYQRRWQAIRREAARRLIDNHRDEYNELVNDIKRRIATH